MANKAASSRKKKVLEPEIMEPEEVMVDEADESYEPIRPVATRRHRIVTEYTEKKPLDEIDALPDEDEEEHNAQQIAVPPDPIEAFLDGMGGSTARWDMVVYRLPKYWQDARTDPASRVRCGRIDFTEEYENEVQRRWARPNLRNDFVIVVKKNGQYHKQLPTFSCEPALPEERINQPDASNPPTAPPQVNFFPVYEEQSQHNGTAAPAAMPDPMKQLKELLQMQKLMRDALGPAEQPVPPPAPAPLTDPDAILISSLASNDKFMDRIGSGLIGKLINPDGSDKNDPSPWAVAMRLVETGQAARIAETIINSVFNGFRGMIPGGMNNGQTQMASTPTQMDNGQMRPSTEQGMVQRQVSQDDRPQGTSNVLSTEIRQDDVQQQQMTPADQALATVLSDCARKIPPQVTFGNLMTYADFLNDQAPAYSIDGWITFFATMPIDDALEFVKSLPNGEQVASLPHAKEWTEQFQKLIRESQEGEGE